MSVGGTVLIVHSGNGKTGWRNVSRGLFTHQRVCVGVDEGQTQLVKVKVFSIVESLR